MNELLLGFAFSLFSLGDYQDSTEFSPTGYYITFNNYAYAEVEVYQKRHKLCYLDENYNGLCLDFCFEDEKMEKGICTPLDN